MATINTNINRVAPVAMTLGWLLLGCESSPADPIGEDALGRSDSSVQDASSAWLPDGKLADGAQTSPEDAAADAQATGAVYACPLSEPSLSDLQRCTSAPQHLGTVGHGPVLGDVLGGAVSPDGQSLFVVSQLPQLRDGWLSLFKVDLQSGDRTLISGYDEQRAKVGSGPDLGPYFRITAAGKIFVNSPQHLVTVDPQTGHRTLRATWTSRSDLCRSVEGSFDISGETIFYFGHNNALTSRGWLRYDTEADNCEAVSWCRMSTPVDEGGEGPCPSVAPRPLLLYDGHLWSTDYLRSAVLKVDPLTGVRRFASRTTQNPSETVGMGTGCLRVQRTPGDGSTVAVMGNKLWLSGDVIDAHNCERGHVDMVAVDPQTGSRTPAFVSTGPLAGAAGDAVGSMWAHPMHTGVLLVAASRGIALYEPASQLSVYLSR